MALPQEGSRMKRYWDASALTSAGECDPSVTIGRPTPTRCRVYRPAAERRPLTVPTLEGPGRESGGPRAKGGGNHAQSPARARPEAVRLTEGLAHCGRGVERPGARRRRRRVHGGAVLSKSGPADEGPYPYAYPASVKREGPARAPRSAASKCKTRREHSAPPTADPCISKFTGNNAAPTDRGVTPTRIILAQRQFPSTGQQPAGRAQAEAAGVAAPAVTDQVEQVFLDYFNKVFDLYGPQGGHRGPMTATGNRP